MKKLISIIILYCIILTSLLVVSCDTPKETAPKSSRLQSTFFDGSNVFVSEFEGSTKIQCSLSKYADTYSNYFVGWSVNGELVEEIEAEIEINSNAVITPVFDIKYTQTIPETLDLNKSIENVSGYSDFTVRATPSFIFPGLSNKERTTIQGVAYYEKYNWVFLSAYSFASPLIKNSVIYILDMNQKDANGNNGLLIKTALLFNMDGTDYTGHVGGIVVTEDSLYITRSNGLYRIDLERFTAPSDLLFLSFDEDISLSVTSAFCFYRDNVLWVGEFEYEEENYKTEDSHKTTIDGEKYYSWIQGFKLNDKYSFSYSKNNIAIPDYLLLAGNKIQGFALTEDSVVLSSSYGRRNDSKWLYYNLPDWDKATRTTEIEGKNVPTINLTSPKELTMPPMSEDMAIYTENGKEYLLFVTESSSYKYFNGNSLNPTSICWKIDT